MPAKTPWDTKKILDFIENGEGSNEELGRPFDFTLENKYLRQNWNNSFDHFWLILKGILNSKIFLNGETTWNDLVKNNNLRPGNLASSLEKIKKLKVKDQNRLEKLLIHPQQFDMISEIAFLIFSIIKEAGIQVGHTYLENPNTNSSTLIYFEQASFLRLNPFKIHTYSDGQKYFDDLFGPKGGPHQKGNFSGWQDSIEIKKDFNSKKGVRSLCHFPVFFFHPDAWVVSLIPESQGKQYDFGNKDRSFSFFEKMGVGPYLKRYAAVQKTPQPPLLLLWLGIGPKYLVDNPVIMQGDHLIASFWACRLYNAQRDIAEKIKAAIYRQIDKIRYNMLLGFSKELINELENQHAELEQAKRESDFYAESHKRIQEPLRNLIWNLLNTQADAHYIQGVVDPLGALFSCQPKIEDIFNKQGMIEGPYLQDLPNKIKIRRRHKVTEWQFKEKKWVAAKLAYLMCGDNETIKKDKKSEHALKNAWEKLIDINDSKKEKKILDQRIRVWLHPDQFGQEAYYYNYYEELIHDDILLGDVLGYLKERFHTYYKGYKLVNIELQQFAVFMEAVDFNHYEFDTELKYDGKEFPLKSYGHLIEVIASLIYHTIFENNSLKCTFIANNSDNQFGSKIYFNFRPFCFLKNDGKENKKNYNVEIQNLCNSFKSIMNSKTISGVAIGDMTKLLMNFCRYTMPGYMINSKVDSTVFPNKLILEWNNQKGDVVMVIELSPSGISLPFSITS